MVTIEASPAYATVTMARFELDLIRSALNELVNRDHADDDAFATHIGVTREEARKLLAQLEAVPG